MDPGHVGPGYKLRRSTEHGPRPHARAASEKALLACGKPHLLSDLRWAGLRKAHTSIRRKSRQRIMGKP